MPGRRAPLALLLLRDQAQLLQGRHPVDADLLGDQPVLDLDHGHAGELHLLAATRRQRADQDVIERLPGLGAAGLPLADDVVTLGDQIAVPAKPRSGNTARNLAANART
jgi:hypothetical protein